MGKTSLLDLQPISRDPIRLHLLPVSLEIGVSTDALRHSGRKTALEFGIILPVRAADLQSYKLLSGDIDQLMVLPLPSFGRAGSSASQTLVITAERPMSVGPALRPRI